MVCILSLAAGGPSALAQAPADVLEPLTIDRPLTQISLLGDAIQDLVVVAGEPMAHGYEPGRVLVLADAGRATGPGVAGDGRLVATPIHRQGAPTPDPFFSILRNDGCVHRSVRFFRKSVGGRPVALYAARTWLEQDPDTTTWDNDLDHAVLRLTLYVLTIGRGDAPGPPFRLDFRQVGASRVEAPTCDPQDATEVFLPLMRADGHRTAYPAQ